MHCKFFVGARRAASCLCPNLQALIGGEASLAPTDRDLLPSPRCGMVIGASIATLMLMR